MHTGVGTFSGAKAKPESVMYNNNTKYGEDPDQMRGSTPSQAVHEDGQWRSSIKSSTWQGSMPASYSRSTSSRRAQRKVLQQLAEELKAEYMEGKGTASVRTRSAAEATTAAAADRHGSRAGPKELQMEPNVTSLCVLTARRAVVICVDCDQ